MYITYNFKENKMNKHAIRYFENYSKNYSKKFLLECTIHGVEHVIYKRLKGICKNVLNSNMELLALSECLQNKNNIKIYYYQKRILELGEILDDFQSKINEPLNNE